MKKRVEPVIPQQRRKLLFLAGVLADHTQAYYPPACPFAARHFRDGQILARQGWVRLVDREQADLFIKEVVS